MSIRFGGGNPYINRFMQLFESHSHTGSDDGVVLDHENLTNIGVKTHTEIDDMLSTFSSTLATKTELNAGLLTLQNSLDALDATLTSKVNIVNGKSLVLDTEITKLAGIPSDTQAQIDLKADVENTYDKGDIDALLSDKVDKDGAKVLSTNDYLNSDKWKLSYVPLISTDGINFTGNITNPNLTTYYNGLTIIVKFNNSTTGNGIYINLNNLGNKQIVKENSETSDIDYLKGSDINTGYTHLLTYQNGIWKIIGKNYTNWDKIRMKPSIIDNLTSTSATDILSAKQGKVLNDTKVDKETGKSLVSDTEITKLANQSGINTGDETNETIKTKLGTDLSNKVDKDGTKVLSDNNYTDAEQSKVANLPANANNTFATKSESLLYKGILPAPSDTENNVFTHKEIADLENGIYSYTQEQVDLFQDWFGLFIIGHYTTPFKVHKYNADGICYVKLVSDEPYPNNSYTLYEYTVSFPVEDTDQFGGYDWALPSAGFDRLGRDIHNTYATKTTPTFTGTSTFQTDAIGNQTSIFKAISGQTSRLMQFQSSTGAEIGYVNASGDVIGRYVSATSGLTTGNLTIASTTGFYNQAANNGTFMPTVNGATITRNIADANPALKINQINASSTGDLLQLAFNNVNKTVIKTDGSPESIKFKITAEGGYAIKLTNRTGVNSVKGQIVKCDTANDNSFIVTGASDDFPIGIVYENGIANGSECWIVVSGIADVLIKDTVAPVRGYVAFVSNVGGRADISATAPVNDHWREIGHTLESKSAGTDILIKCVLHFN